MFTYSATITNWWFGPVIVLLIFLIAFISMKEYRTAVAWTAASFITALLAIFLWTIGVVNDLVVILPIISTVGGFAALQFG